MPSREHLEDLKRYGMDPDPRADDYFRDMTPGMDERHVPLHPSVAGGSWGEAADDEDGEA